MKDRTKDLGFVGNLMVRMLENRDNSTAMVADVINRMSSKYNDLIQQIISLSHCQNQSVIDDLRKQAEEAKKAINLFVKISHPSLHDDKSFIKDMTLKEVKDDLKIIKSVANDDDDFIILAARYIQYLTDIGSNKDIDRQMREYIYGPDKKEEGTNDEGKKVDYPELLDRLIGKSNGPLPPIANALHIAMQEYLESWMQYLYAKADPSNNIIMAHRCDELDKSKKIIELLHELVYGITPIDKKSRTTAEVIKDREMLLEVAKHDKNLFMALDERYNEIIKRNIEEAEAKATIRPDILKVKN